LRLFFTSRNGLRSTKKSVSKRTFSVINVGNNAKISNMFHNVVYLFLGVPAEKAVGLSVPIFWFLKKKPKGFPLLSLTQSRK
jgi:hypothetical protein